MLIFSDSNRSKLRGNLLDYTIKDIAKSIGFHKSTGCNMFGRTPYEALKDTGLLNPEKLITFPIMILEEHIETIRKIVEFLLYENELAQIKKKWMEKCRKNKLWTLQ